MNGKSLRGSDSGTDRDSFRDFTHGQISDSYIRLLFAYNTPERRAVELNIGGFKDHPDWPKMGPSLLIATCLILAIRTAKWAARSSVRRRVIRTLKRKSSTRRISPAEYSPGLFQNIPRFSRCEEALRTSRTERMSRNRR